MLLSHHQVVDVNCTTQLDVRWLVCSGASVAHYVNTLNHRASGHQLRLIQVPGWFVCCAFSLKRSSQRGLLRACLCGTVSRATWTPGSAKEKAPRAMPLYQIARRRAWSAPRPFWFRILNGRSLHLAPGAGICDGRGDQSSSAHHPSLHTTPGVLRGRWSVYYEFDKEPFA